jgi:hypothetical protein
MGSFTTSNGTATNLEQKFDESTPPPPPSSQTTPSNGHSASSNHKHPPLSYVQHMRSMQHLTQQEQKYHLPIRPLSGDISSFMTRSATMDFHSSNEDTNVCYLLLSVFLIFISNVFRSINQRKNLRFINHQFNVI